MAKSLTDVHSVFLVVAPASNGGGFLLHLVFLNDKTKEQLVLIMPSLLTQPALSTRQIIFYKIPAGKGIHLFRNNYGLYQV